MTAPTTAERGATFLLRDGRDGRVAAVIEHAGAGKALPAWRDDAAFLDGFLAGVAAAYGWRESGPREQIDAVRNALQRAAAAAPARARG